MAWNWQHADWPNFRWNTARMASAEERFLLDAGRSLGTQTHLDPGDRERLIVELMGSEALTTSAIEGEILDRDSVQSSIQRQLGLTADRRRIPPAEQGIAEMTVDLYRTTGEDLSEKSLFRWHRMLALARIADIGKYRTSDEPMQIVSGPIGAQTIHFEAPPSRSVPSGNGSIYRLVQPDATAGQGRAAGAD